mgnify:CR=1 FL=1
MLKSLRSEVKDLLQQEDSDSLDNNGSLIPANKPSTVTHATMATKVTAQAVDIVDLHLTGGESARCELGNRIFPCQAPAQCLQQAAPDKSFFHSLKTDVCGIFSTNAGQLVTNRGSLESEFSELLQEDKYSFECFNEQFLAQNLSEYKQGVSPLILKDGLKACGPIWKSIGSPSWYLDVICNGYRIPFVATPPSEFIRINKCHVSWSDINLNTASACGCLIPSNTEH